MRHIPDWISLTVHVVLLLLASTRLTILPFGQVHRYTWDYLTYSHQNGFGCVYQSDFSLPVVITYILAYLAGLVTYGILRARGWQTTGLIGYTLSLIGLVSFAFEATHWVTAHNRSWIASSPLLMLAIAAITAYQMFATRRT